MYILLEMEKRLVWSGIPVKARSYSPLLLQDMFSPLGSLICYEFLSPLTPLKVFSWRSWQIESDRQTGSSVRPQESHSSQVISPSIHYWRRALIAWLSVASRAVSPSGPFTVLSAPWKREEETINWTHTREQWVPEVGGYVVQAFYTLILGILGGRTEPILESCPH